MSSTSEYSVEIGLYMTMLDTCPCCGYRTAESQYDICEICGWEDDYVQRRYPDAFGANRVTLRQAQKNFVEHGVKDPARAGDLGERRPDASDNRNEHWLPVNLAT